MTMDLIDAVTISNIKSVHEKSSLNRRMCIRFESREICVAGNQCDNNDFDFHNAEHKELPVIKISSDEGRLRRLSTIETKRDSGFFGNY